MIHTYIGICQKHCGRSHCGAFQPAECVKNSSLFNQNPVYTIPNPIDLQKWKPINKEFARNALKIIFDIDENELLKSLPPNSFKIKLSANDAISELEKAFNEFAFSYEDSNAEWLDFCGKLKKRFSFFRACIFRYFFLSSLIISPNFFLKNFLNFNTFFNVSIVRL